MSPTVQNWDVFGSNFVYDDYDATSANTERICDMFVKVGGFLAFGLLSAAQSAIAGGCAPYRCVNVNIGEIETRSDTGDLIVSFVEDPVGLACDASGNAGYVVGRVPRSIPSFDIMVLQVQLAATVAGTVTVEFENIPGQPCRIRRMNSYM